MSFDPDTINQIAKEECHQEQEERELKNRVLNLSNFERKQELWSKYFPQTNYIKTNIIF